MPSNVSRPRFPRFAEVAQRASHDSRAPRWARPLLAGVLVMRGGPSYLRRLSHQHFHAISSGCDGLLAFVGAALAVVVLGASKLGIGPLAVLVSSVVAMILIARIGAPVARERRRRRRNSSEPTRH